MDTAKRTRTCSTMSELLAQLSPQDVVDFGHVVLFPNDGTAVDIDINSMNDFRDIEKCPRCSERLTVNRVWLPGGEFIAARCSTDDCRKDRENAQVARNVQDNAELNREKIKQPHFMKRFNVPSGYHHCSFDNFRNHEGFAGAVECVYETRDFAAKRAGIFLITGNTGTGKSHLAIAIIREIAEHGENSIVFDSVAGMISKFKIAYHGEGKSEYEMIQDYAGVKVLVLDDLGVENITQNSTSLIQQIIEERASRPTSVTIVTSNFKPAKIEQIYGARIHSRLMSGKHLHINAHDYRMRGKK